MPDTDAPGHLVLLQGVDDDALTAAMLSLQWDLPRAVAVRHSIDVDEARLHRTVSDADGLVERTSIDLAGACTSCTWREDLAATLRRLRASGRWSSVLAQLPPGMSSVRLCAGPDGADATTALGVDLVVTALAGGSVVDDLLGPDLLAERGCPVATDDDRGVGEVASAMVESADAVLTVGRTEPVAADLIRTLARPDAAVLDGADALSYELVATRPHDPAAIHAWTDPLTVRPSRPSVPDRATRAACGVWQLDLRSEQPFHPGRLAASAARLGNGRHRSRGCFWLPSRPDDVLVWEGAGGQVSIGTGGRWGDRPRHTRLLFTGTVVAPDDLVAAFGALVLRPGEALPTGDESNGTDGYERWLGPIGRAA